MKENYKLSILFSYLKNVQVATALLTFLCFMSTESFASYYWQVSAITGITGGNTYSMNAPASPITININQCAGGISQPHNSTIYNITWYKNTVNSTVGGTLVASSVVGTPYSFTTTQSYTPSTSTSGTLYYYAVLSNPSMTTCGFTSTLTSPTTAVTVASPAAALNFDGNDDFVNIGNSVTSSLSGGHNITVEAWVNPETMNNLGCIIGNYNTSSNNNLQFLLRRSTNSYYEFWVGNGGVWNQLTSSIAPVSNVWQHVAATWDGSVSKIYINGIIAGTINTAISSFGTANNNNIWIGANNINENFNGKIDEVRVWNRTLSQAEIQNNMNGEILTTANGLMVNYHFNQGVNNGNNASITTLNDASGSSINGTLNNFSLTGSTSNWIAPGAVPSGIAVPQFINVITTSIVSQSNVNCHGGNNGSATITASGEGNLTYSWSPTGGTSATATGLIAGNYICTVSNEYGTTANQTVTISEPAAISAISYVTICGNQSYSIGTSTYTTTGVYTDILSNSNGCDSTVVTHLTVHPIYSFVDTVTIEQGQSALIGGVNRTTAGDYPSHYSSINGCDSTITTTLNVLLMSSPSNLIATPFSQTQINLSWADNSQNEFGYMIERALTSNGTFEQVGFTNQNETTFTDLELIANTNYCYRIVAMNSNGEFSTYSSIVCASTFPVIISPASYLTATPLSQTSVQLNWSDNSSTESGFIIVSEINGQGFSNIDTVASNITTYLNTGLLANTTYNYKIITYNIGGNAPFSNTATALTFDNLPNAPINLIATSVSAIDVQLTWNDVSTNEDLFLIQRSASSGSGFFTIATVVANTTSFNDFEGLNSNTEVYYRIVAVNSGGNTFSNEAYTQTLATAGYVMDSVFMNCRDASFCMPIKLNHTISGVIGYDFTVNFDTTKYDFDGISINSALINPAFTEFSTYSNANGTVKVLVNIIGSAPSNTSFNGNGSLLCMNFIKHLDYEQGVDQISISNILESYATGTIFQTISNGVVKVDKDTLAPGVLRTWNNNQVMSYNSANQNQFLITKIYGSNITNTTQSTNFVTPDINGKFNHNIYDGNYIKIVRDIAASTIMMPFINGLDVQKIKQIAQSDANFLPNAFQIIAADVNMDGQVTAGDVTLVKQRLTLTIGQYPQAWNVTNGEASKDWIFVDSMTVVSATSFQRSTIYPAYDGIGFNKNHVPHVGLTLPVAVDYTGNCPEFSTSYFKGILLGDIDGNFNQMAAGGTKSMDINSIAFEIAAAVQHENCVVDIPFYTGEFIGDSVFAIDFDMAYNNSQLEFDEIIYNNSSSSSEQLYNQVDGNRILFTSSDVYAYAPSTLLGYIRFNVLANQISATDFGTITSYINGIERNVSIEGLSNCANYNGLQEVEETQNLHVFPNPHSDNFVVELNTATDKNVEIYLTNVYGEIVQIIENGTVTGTYKKQVNTSELTSGVYFLTMKSNGQTIVNKLVKK
ncbi:MAG: fibronectin type III domain-containing protein [Flavobacteriia bacterium]|nr:fibronectin type III domain-containing protein [Flavobacteriia bacterium]